MIQLYSAKLKEQLSTRLKKEHADLRKYLYTKGKELGRAIEKEYDNLKK